MTFLLKQLFDLVKLLNSETGTTQIAAGMALGFALGLSPIFSLQGLIIFSILIIFRVQFGAAMLSAFFFSFVAYVFDPLLHILGYEILTMPSLQSLFTELYNMPIIPFTRFNNTIVMGSGILGLAFFPILFFLFKNLVEKYRVTVVARFKETKFWKYFQLTSFYKWYCTYDTYKI